MNLVVSLVAIVVLSIPLKADESQEDAPRAAWIPGIIQRTASDERSLRFKYRVPMSPHRYQRLIQFYDWQLRSLQSIDFDALSQDGKIDYLLHKNDLSHKRAKLKREQQQDREVAELIPFAPELVELLEAREAIEPANPKALANQLEALADQIIELKTARSADETQFERKTVAITAARRIDQLKSSMASWYQFYSGYDPLFSWWVKAPYTRFNKELGTYHDYVKTKLGGVDLRDRVAIVGEPIGEEALLQELAFEMIPYTPDELIEIANQQFEWCDQEMLKASQELGFGDDWRAAQDHVKSLHVEPGKQPTLIHDMALEAIEFVESRDLLTVPELCKETWRMQMMSPERQRVSPYFLGGETIIVSYPTDAMSHPDKLMSMRGNNIHFSRATVQHELIPGHHLQGFMTKRHKPYRSLFSTPFWIEGWALYWEMQLWDLDFPRSAEDKIGMLFWRKHRCARIIFSLSYHLNKMTAQECIEFLVDRVGHERNNATAEVRRSVEGGYGPLYQAAYMLGGLQIRSLYRDLVEDGDMSARDFHDSVLKENSIPIELIRARLTDQKLTSEFESSWRFAD